MKGMTAKKKRFLTVTLPKYILREQGRGFAMDEWIVTEYSPGESVSMDDVERRIPTCGSASCIGGSTAILHKHPRVRSSKTLGRLLGLSGDEAHGLFYNWQNKVYAYGVCAWPREFRIAYDATTTPLAKAKVAVRLLELVAKTEGACLHPEGEHVKEGT
jgi:hypothetical protein